jgi:hypothetical protein
VGNYSIKITITAKNRVHLDKTSFVDGIHAVGTKYGQNRVNAELRTTPNRTFLDIGLLVS